MSANPSFFDSTIIKGKQIIWTIDLSKRENGLQENIPIRHSSPKNLFQFAENHINDLDFNLSTMITLRQPKDAAKSIRKLVKKIIKRKKIRLSELSSELRLSKGNLKKWLVKGENPQGDHADYPEILKTWLGAHKNFLSQDEMYDVVNQFNKSMRKNLNKSIPENPQIASPFLFEAVVIDNRFPIQKINPLDNKKESSNMFNLIQIDASLNEISINDSFLWDEQDTSPATLQQFALTLVQDVLEDQKIVASEATIQGLVRQIAEQIKDQVDQSTNIKSQVEPLIGFNGNSSTFKQKEQILCISLDIDEDNIRIQDSFDWEIDPVMNQPENFAEKYVEECQLPHSFISIIALQIREQIDEYLQKRLKNFSQLFEPKVDETDSNQPIDDKRKINNKIKKNILLSLNESLETFPIVPPFKNEPFLRDQELLNLLDKYTDFLAPIHKKIYFQQKSFSASIFSQQPFKDPKSGGSANKNKSNSKMSRYVPGQAQFSVQNARFLQPTQKYSKTSQGNNGANTRLISAPVLANMQNNLPVNMMREPMGNLINPNAVGEVPGMTAMYPGINNQLQGYMQYGQVPTGDVRQDYNFVQQENIQSNTANIPIYKMDDNSYLKG